MNTMHNSSKNTTVPTQFTFLTKKSINALIMHN